MIPEIGLFALIITLLICVTQLLNAFGVFGREYAQKGVLVRRLTLAHWLCVLLSYAILTYCFIVNDFSVRYVANNSYVNLPVIYRICAVWGAHEGSMLLWLFILSAWMIAVAKFSKTLPEQFVARILQVLHFISLGFCCFILFTSNPFARLLPVPHTHGMDLNPMLQDPGLIIHPPMLYMGYVGFSVAFAFAIAALLTRHLDTAWAKWVRPWTLIAWSFLTYGITLGSWWSYHELGWGGWWFWDPVENASFMPWLLGTALVHSLIMVQKKDAFKAWAVLLAIGTFSLSLLGTFLVRSGVLTSVHAFAVDPTRGLYMLVFLCLVTGGSLLLYALKGWQFESSTAFTWLSRGTLLLVNNLLLVVLTLTTLLGTLYPLIIDALGFGKISVGPPYFNQVFIPIMIPMMIFMSLVPSISWDTNAKNDILKRIWVSPFIALILSLVFVLTFSINAWGVGVTLFLSLWIMISSFAILVCERRYGWIGLKAKSPMVIAHVGLAVCALGIVLSSTYEVEKNMMMRQGDVASLTHFQIKLTSIGPLEGPNYRGENGLFTVKDKNKRRFQINAQKKLFEANGMAISMPGISAGFFEDIYIALGNPVEDKWEVRLYYKPFVRWIWMGGLLMCIGGLCSILNKRKRKIE